MWASVNVRVSSAAEEILAYKEDLCSMKLVS
jgi:hypothetical protein